MTVVLGQQLGKINSKIQQTAPKMGSLGSRAVKLRTPLVFILLTSFHLITTVWSFRPYSNQRNMGSMGIINNIHLLDLLKRSGDRNWEEIDPNCGIYRHEALHAVMDRVCELCHEMFSHEQNSLRAECRSNCFRNRKFRACLQIFSPSANGTENKLVR